jgi:hypothetical protein
MTQQGGGGFIALRHSTAPRSTAHGGAGVVGVNSNAGALLGAALAFSFSIGLHVRLRIDLPRAEGHSRQVAAPSDTYRRLLVQ